VCVCAAFSRTPFKLSTGERKGNIRGYVLVNN